MLRWFPRLEAVTACFSCSPPDLNFLDPYFIFMYMHYNHCHRATAHLQLNILLLLLVLFNFFLNRILICYGCSQISDLFHPLKENLINAFILTSSKLIYWTKIEFQPHRELIAHYKHPRTNAVHCYSRGALSCHRRAIPLRLPLTIQTLLHFSTVTRW